MPGRPITSRRPPPHLPAARNGKYSYIRSLRYGWLYPDVLDWLRLLEVQPLFFSLENLGFPFICFGLYRIFLGQPQSFSYPYKVSNFKLSLQGAVLYSVPSIKPKTPTYQSKLASSALIELTVPRVCCVCAVRIFTYENQSNLPRKSSKNVVFASKAEIWTNCVDGAYIQPNNCGDKKLLSEIYCTVISRKHREDHLSGSVNSHPLHKASFSGQFLTTRRFCITKI